MYTPTILTLQVPRSLLTVEKSKAQKDTDVYSKEEAGLHITRQGHSSPLLMPGPHFLSYSVTDEVGGFRRPSGKGQSSMGQGKIFFCERRSSL